MKNVFEHVKGPNNFVKADPEPVRLSNLALTPEGVGSTWETSWRDSDCHFTREGPAPSTS